MRYIKKIKEKFITQTLRKKIIASIMLVAVLIIFIAWISVEGIISNNFINEIKNAKLVKAKDIAELSRDFILTKDISGLTELYFDEKARNEDLAYILFYDDKGKIIAHNLLEPKKEDIYHILLENKDSQPIMSFRDFKGKPVLDIYIPIFEEDVYIGTLCIGFYKEYIDVVLNRIRLLAVGLLGIGAVITFFLSLFLTKVIVEPIDKIAETARKIGKGELKIRIKSQTKDEIGMLAEEFNNMAKSLQDRDRKLKESSKEIKKSAEELRTRVDELERFHNLTVGRELKMIELKKKIKKFESKRKK